MTTLTHILVPTDFSEPAQRALAYAGDLARRTGARLTVMYADNLIPPLDAGVEMRASAYATTAMLEERARHDIAADVRKLIDPTVDVKTIIRIATAEEGILAQARESKPDLIVMGTHGRSGVPRLVFGSVTEAVMRGANVPVLAVSPESETKSSINTIVSCVDFSEAWLQAINLAGSLTPEDAHFFIIGAVSPDAIHSTAALREIEEWTPAALASRCRFMLFSKVHFAENVARFAQRIEANLLVATEPHVRNIVEVLRGTVAERLMQSSHCPVLTVTEPESSSHAGLPVDRDAGVTMF